MCLSKVYLKKNSDLELIMEDTAIIQVDDTFILLKDLFGASTRIEAKVQSIDLMKHTVVLVNT